MSTECDPVVVRGMMWRPFVRAAEALGRRLQRLDAGGFRFLVDSQPTIHRVSERSPETFLE